jgi:drug/metabolite transporter (DMT)-like permease
MNPKASLVLGICCIAFSPILVRLAGVPALTSGFYRIFIGWVCLAPYCIIKNKLKTNRGDLLIAMLGGIVFASDIAVWHLSLLKISATVSTLLANLAPVWVGLLSYLLFKKRSGGLFWIGTIVAVAGMAILVGYQNVIHLQFNAGILLALLASFLYACYIMITKGILQKVETMTFMFYNMLAASIFLLIICLFEHTEIVRLSISSWECLIAMGVVCQLTGWITINYAIKRLPATKVSIALLSQTVIAGFLAIFLLNERLDLKEIIGSVIVLGGIAISFITKPMAKI